jgi:hypothetical protein
MNGVLSAAVSGSDATALAHYEHLRRHVLGQEHDHEGAPGLALVMRGGMHACLAMVEPTGTVRPAVAPHAEAATEIDGGLRDDVARVIVAMAIGAALEKEARAWLSTCRAKSKRDT